MICVRMAVGRLGVKRTTLAISRTKPTAAMALRSRYQDCASVTSVRAAGWNLISILPAEQLAPHFLPWNRLYGTISELGDSTTDFSLPCSFDFRIALGIE